MALQPTIVFGKKDTTQVTNAASCPPTSENSEYKPKSVFGSSTRLSTPVDNNAKEATVVFKNSVLRKQIILTVEELKLKFPQLSDKQILSAQTIIRTTNIQDDDDKDLLDWGTNLQKNLSKQLDEELTLMQSSELDIIKSKVAEIITQLNEFTRIVSQNEETFTTKVAAWFSNPRKDFDARYIKLKAVVDFLSDKTPVLSAYTDKIKAINKGTESIKSEIEILIAAGTSILEYINQHKSELGSNIKTFPQISLIERRLISLNTTLATIQQSVSQRQLTLQTLDQLLVCIQDVLLVELPLWRNNYIAILSVDRSNTAEYSRRVNEFLSNQQKMLEKLKQN